MARTDIWKPFAEPAARWVLRQTSADSLWDFIEGKVEWRSLGLTASKMKIDPELISVKPSSKDWKYAHNRVYYFFHLPATKDRPLTRSWAEWPIDIPIRSDQVDRIIEVTALITKTETISRDPIRYFPDHMVLAWVKLQGGRCFHCPVIFGPEAKPVGDHIHPWSLGGPTTWENGCASCSRCNNERGAMSIVEWQAHVRKKYAGGRSFGEAA